MTEDTPLDFLSNLSQFKPLAIGVTILGALFLIVATGLNINLLNVFGYQALKIAIFLPLLYFSIQNVFFPTFSALATENNLPEVATIFQNIITEVLLNYQIFLCSTKFFHVDCV